MVHSSNLQAGVEGLVHVSEMSWIRKNIHPGKLVSTSEELEVEVLAVDPDKRRISLGIKQCQDNPWNSFAGKFPKGTEIEGSDPQYHRVWHVHRSRWSYRRHGAFV